MASSIQKITSGGKTKYRAFYTTPEIGKRLTRLFPLKAHAQAWLKDLERNPDKATTLAHGKAVETFADACDAYMRNYTGKDPAISSRVGYWRDHLGQHKFKDLNANHVRRAYDLLEAGNAQQGRRGKCGKHKIITTTRARTGATINRYKASLGSVVRFIRLEYGIDLKPALATLPTRKESKGRIRYLSEVEREALLTACQASEWPKLYLATAMALYSGCRLGELQKVSWSAIDWKLRTAVVHDTKNGDSRSLILPMVVIEELMKHRPKPTREDLLNHRQPDGLVFASDGDKWSSYDFRKHWDKALKDAGISDFRFHDLRHSCASYLAQSGATLLQIGSILGHRNPTTTLRYAHMCVGEQRNLIDRLAASHEEVAK